MNQGSADDGGPANRTSGTDALTGGGGGGCGVWGGCAHFTDAGVGPEPRAAGTRTAQFVYII